jgi:hypothetical protein
MIRKATRDDLRNLVLVPGHGVCKAGCAAPEVVERESSWAAAFPREGRFYVEHIRRGVELAAGDPAGALVLSGGQTRAEAGTRSEAESYHEIATAAGWWGRPEVADRTLLEEFARDSLENLLFALARFYQATGRWPETVTVVGWEIKSLRFMFHSRALEWPQKCFHYVGVNNPEGDAYEAARQGEREKIRALPEDPFYAGPRWAAQRSQRDPFRRGHPYRGIDPGLDSLLDAMEGRTQSPRPPWAGPPAGGAL